MKKNYQTIFKKHPFNFACASLFGVGLLPASGTWGSLVALLIAPFLIHSPLLIWTAVIVSFFLGVAVIPALIKNQTNKDPGYVVIDELMGQLVVFAFLPYSFANPLTYLFGFLFFRLFDILKPWPVSFFDREVRNAWGIMLDDLMAGIYASCVLALIQILSLY